MGTLGRVFLMCCLNPEHTTNQFVVDTFSRLNAIKCKLWVFGAALNFHSIHCGGSGDVFHKFTQIFFWWFQNRNSLLFQQLQPFSSLSIDIHHTDDGAAGIALSIVPQYAGMSPCESWDR